MRTLSLLSVTLILISSSGFAGEGWLDLFADADHSTWCVYPSGLYTPVDAYLFARPPADGFRAMECKIVMPDPAAILILEDWHPDVNLTMGDWKTGMSVTFTVCQLDPWVLICHFQWITIPTPAGDGPWGTGCQTVELAPSDESQFFGFVGCSGSI